MQSTNACPCWPWHLSLWLYWKRNWRDKRSWVLRSSLWGWGWFSLSKKNEFSTPMQKIMENVFPFSEKITRLKKVAPLSLKRPFFTFFFGPFFGPFFDLWCHFSFYKYKEYVIIMLSIITYSQKKDLKKGPKVPKKDQKRTKNEYL